jgi:replication-associated recombination protein RarA
MGMAMQYPNPSCLNDFALKPQTRSKLEAVLQGVVQVPGNGISGLLLYGLYGSGKTTMARLLPGWLETTKATNVLANKPVDQVVDTQATMYDFHSCAQGQNGTSLMNSIQNQCSFVSLSSSGLHYILLDELDNLTSAAQASLKAIMNFKHVVFIMTTNNLNQIDKGVMNRSILIDMNAAPTLVWVNKILNDLQATGGKTMPAAAIEEIVEAGKGSCRTILTDVTIASSLRDLDS